MFCHDMPDRPLLSTDIFLSLTAATFCTHLSTKFSLHHLARLCYYAELVKVVVALIDGAAQKNCWVQTAATYKGTSPNWLLPESVCEFIVQNSGQWGDASSQMVWIIRQPVVSQILEKYALVFLRRVLILFSARGFAFSAKSGGSELERCCQQLQLPTPAQFFANINKDTSKLVGGWCQHHQIRRSTLSLNHPVIFELIKLPLALDSLFSEGIIKPCRKCGKIPVQEPALCLLCGESVCYQAFCCQENDIGECNLHKAKCGGDVGLYLILKKCAILCLSGKQGSFMVAPYLDSHGEADLGLRRGRPQFLQQKRYDLTVRKMWLQHDIASFVARKLEASVDVGGWDSL